MSFYGDVITKDPRFHAQTRVDDIALLEPVMRSAVDQMIRDALLRGVKLQPLETYRSQERQMMLFHEGATQLERVGVHHFGLACDLGILIGGEINWKANYSILGELAQKNKLVWGGDWGAPRSPHSFRDYDHVQRISVNDQSRLFSGQWYPDPSYIASSVG